MALTLCAITFALLIALAVVAVVAREHADA